MDNNEKLETGLAEISGLNVEERINRELAEYDDFHHLIVLLYRVNDFQPRKEWIIPILESRECLDLKTRLLMTIEDYEELHCKNDHSKSE